MARHRTPSNILELKGAYKRNPERRNHDEPEATPFVDKPPAYFDAQHIRAWNDVIDRVPAGVLKNADYYLVVLAAAIVVEIEEKSGHISNERMGRFVSISACLAITPSSRSSFVVPKAKKNKFSELVK